MSLLCLSWYNINVACYGNKCLQAEHCCWWLICPYNDSLLSNSFPISEFVSMLFISFKYLLFIMEIIMSCGLMDKRKIVFVMKNHLLYIVVLLVWFCLWCFTPLSALRIKYRIAILNIKWHNFLSDKKIMFFFTAKSMWLLHYLNWNILLIFFIKTLWLKIVYREIVILNKTLLKVYQYFIILNSSKKYFW